MGHVQRREVNNQKKDFEVGASEQETERKTGKEINVCGERGREVSLRDGEGHRG